MTRITNYGELKQAVLDDTHRQDLSIRVDRFIQQGEGMIRRTLTAYPFTESLTDTNRVDPDGAVYQLSAEANIIRSVDYVTNRPTSLSLAKVTPQALRTTSTQIEPTVYAQYTKNLIEFRGLPETGAQFDVLYFGIPAALLQDSDTNELLADHPMLYLAGAKFNAYVWLQDRELAADELEIFNGVVDTLNEQTDRQLSGEQVADTYNFGGGSTY